MSPHNIFSSSSSTLVGDRCDCVLGLSSQESWGMWGLELLEI